MVDDFNKNDLYILLESYKENAKLFTTLMNQLDVVVDKQNMGLDKQKRICESLGIVVERITTNTAVLANLQTNICTEQTKNRSECAKEHSGLGLKLYVAFFGMLTLLGSLVGILIQNYQTLDYIKLIAKHFGI